MSYGAPFKDFGMGSGGNRCISNIVDALRQRNPQREFSVLCDAVSGRVAARSLARLHIVGRWRLHAIRAEFHDTSLSIATLRKSALAIEWR
jgi:hypothetical protein